MSMVTLTLKDRTGQDRTGQDRTGQDRTGQGRAEEEEDTLHFNFFDGSLVRVKVRARIEQG